MINGELIEWRDTYIYGEQYEVSNTGMVRNKITGHILKQQEDNKGYLRVRLSLHDKKATAKVHRLVATAFIPNPNNLPQVNHKDEVKTNDCVNNLEWCTCLYNLTYNDLHHRRNNMNNKKSKQVVQIKEGKVIATYPSINEAARKLNCGSGNIVRCCKGEKKIAYGYQWKYVDPYQPKGE